MPNIREVVADMLANPAQYTDAFPVPERSAPRSTSMWVTPTIGWNGPPLQNGEPITREMIEQHGVREIPELRGARPESAGASLTPEMFDFIRDNIRRMSGYVDPLARMAETATGAAIAEQNEVAQAVREAPTYFTDPPVDENGVYFVDPASGFRQVPVEIRDGQVYVPAMEMPSTAPGTVHRRADGGCSCGYTTIFSGELDSHMQGHNSYNRTPRGMPHNGSTFATEVCYACDRTDLCRRVAIASAPRSFVANFTLTGPSIENRYYCARCYSTFVAEQQREMDTRRGRHRGY